MKLKGCNVDVGMLQATGLRKRAIREREEMNHGTLWYSKWDLEFGERGSQWPVGKLLVWCSLWHSH